METKSGEDVSPPAEPEELVPPEPPPRALRLAEGLALGLPSAAFAIAVMALDRPLHAGIRWAIPLGGVGCLAATVAVLHGAGMFDDRRSPEDDGPIVPWRAIAGPLGSWLLACFGFVLSVAIAAAGAFPTLAIPGLPFALRSVTSLATIVVPASFLGAVSASFRLGRALGFFPDGGDDERPLLRREGFWLIATSAVLYLPMAGGHSLTDPWETHYGEVSREVLARSDWISTWWAQDGFFWSKPVLNFWIQALSMGALGVGYAPDAMLRGTPTPWPEWAVRVPVVIFAIAAQYALYKGVAIACGRRAGLLGGLVLAAMPQWAMLTHQTMADMPFVASMSAAMGLALVGLHADPEARCVVRHLQIGGRTFSLSAAHGVLALVLLAALPQTLYLISRNVELITRDGFGFHLRTDRFWTGSFGNCGLPGNEPCSLRIPAHRDAQPAWQAVGWLAGLGLLLKVERDERRVARLAFLLAAFFAALSTLGKGPAGLALPVLCVLSYLAVTGRARRLLEMEIAGGSLVVATIAAPWFVAMYQRHGMPFIDRLFFHDMWRRALSHVHDTNEGEDTSFRFYVWQLGYALFPFTTLLPASLAAWTRHPEGPADEHNPRRDASVFLAFWLFFAFALFSAMLTKFHHYIFPALPPAAMLLGITLDRWLGEPPPRSRAVSHLAQTFGALICGMTAVLIAGSLCSPGSVLGPASGAAHPVAALAVGACGLGALLWAGRRLLADDVANGAPEDGMTLAEACALVGAGVALFVVGRDLRSPAGSETPGQARLVQLFTYQYQRPWPTSLDFDGTLLAVAAVLSIALALGVWPRARRIALTSFLAGSLVFSFWVVNVYFVSASPHWGQRELFEAYYRQRTSPEEPVIAYQLNWKGENFYTSNHIPVFVSTGERFRGWISEQREKGVRTMYFVTEHRRMDHLHTELGLPRRFERLTDPTVNNKFGLARVTFD